MVVKKTCPECGKASYSASPTGQWVCPYCGADMTDVEPEPVDDARESLSEREGP